VISTALLIYRLIVNCISWMCYLINCIYKYTCCSM